ncbi:hypothetical protein KGF57_004152 [Candida theae]|uniref:Redoxin domain-containing protein n=1 Tax=Candida theae TaxID=1198502 RepID=A0AAD5BBP0_9ASCO|nr:uncharacterized protein KGF57_004152 [Candida theae]KAI5952188.1 hypothetical protein KGF57_004152 [Candida theae]
MTLAQGSPFPEGVKFAYIPINTDDTRLIDPLVCQQPLPLKLDEVIGYLSTTPQHKILIVSVPGAWTPTCGEVHVPPYLQNLASLGAKGIGCVIVLASNDPFVVNSWGKVLVKQFYNVEDNAKGVMPKVIFANDVGGFSRENGLAMDAGGFWRNKRYAVVVDAKTRNVEYLGVETERKVDKSGYETVLAKL